MKTTNAKARAFQTPAPAQVDNENGKPNQKSVSARKAKPRVSHAEMTKLDVLGDKDELEEREVEYMPPRAKGTTISIVILMIANSIQILLTCLMITMKSTSQCSKMVA